MNTPRRGPRKTGRIASPRRSPCSSQMQPVMILPSGLDSLMVPFARIPGAEVELTERVTAENCVSYSTASGGMVSASSKTMRENKIILSPRK